MRICMGSDSHSICEPLSREFLHVLYFSFSMADNNIASSNNTSPTQDAGPREKHTSFPGARQLAPIIGGKRAGDKNNGDAANSNEMQKQQDANVGKCFPRE